MGPRARDQRGATGGTYPELEFAPRRSRVRNDRPPCLRHASIVVRLPAAAATEYPTALIGLVVFVALVFRTRDWAAPASFVLGALVGVLPMLVYHQAAFGAPWLTGYSFKAFATDAAVHAQGFLGVDPPTLEGLWGVLAAISPRPTSGQESTRSILLESMGYPEQARRIQEELQNLAPRRSE